MLWTSRIKMAAAGVLSSVKAPGDRHSWLLFSDSSAVMILPPLSKHLLTTSKEGGSRDS